MTAYNTHVFCPECGDEITVTIQPPEPSVGIMGPWWEDPRCPGNCDGIGALFVESDLLERYINSKINYVWGLVRPMREEA